MGDGESLTLQMKDTFRESANVPQFAFEQLTVTAEGIRKYTGLSINYIRMYIFEMQCTGGWRQMRNSKSYYAKWQSVPPKLCPHLI